ncbi:MAG TPA: protein kinase [Polyangiaceae bacterium]|nr:protein kinase [Polyangiaceae bacterium]
MHDCLSDDTLARLVDGALEESARRAVHEHIDRCPACRRLVVDVMGAASEEPRAPAARPDRPEPRQWLVGLRADATSRRYRLLGKLWGGNMASVWLAEDESRGGAQVAIKLIDSGLARLPEPRARFVREARIAASLESPHLVRVHDHGTTAEGRPYIAMEYLPGESLRDRLRERRRLSLSETEAIVAQACRALDLAHAAGLVHRDLKPENVFLTAGPEGELVKVLDFGLAKEADAMAEPGMVPTRSGALLGTPLYMSPEQAQGLRTVDPRSDLWSLGVLVFECLTGTPPFAAGSLGALIAKILAAPIPIPSQAAPDARLPGAVDAWMARALSRDPAGRFPSARELARAFARATHTPD